jgi:hypothetical protein
MFTGNVKLIINCNLDLDYNVHYVIFIFNINDLIFQIKMSCLFTNTCIWDSVWGGK